MIDPLTVLGRVALYELGIMERLASHYADSAKTYDVLYGTLLRRVSVEVRLKMVGDLIEELAIGEEFDGFVAEMRGLTAVRNTYAHTIWMYVSPRGARWDGLNLRGQEAVHVAVTQAELRNLESRMETVEAWLTRLGTLIPHPVEGRGSQGFAAALTSLHEHWERDLEGVREMQEAVEAEEQQLQDEATSIARSARRN